MMGTQEEQSGWNCFNSLFLMGMLHRLGIGRLGRLYVVLLVVAMSSLISGRQEQLMFN